MSFGYVVRPRADRDIDELADYITGQTNIEMGLCFLSELYDSLALVATQPEMGWHCKISHPQLKTARTIRLSERFKNYLVFYQPFQGRIEIMRVIHGSQDLDELFRKADAFDAEIHDKDPGTVLDKNREWDVPESARFAA